MNNEYDLMVVTSLLREILGEEIPGENIPRKMFLGENHRRGISGGEIFLAGKFRVITAVACIAHRKIQIQLPGQDYC